MKPQNAAQQTPLAIVGMACLFPKADGVGAYWANIRRGVDGITPIPDSHWNADDYFDADPKKPDFTYAKRGGFLSPVDFNPAEFGLAPNALESTDASQLLGLVVAQRALQDAGYGTDKPFDRNKVSVVLGVTGTLQMVVPLGARLGHPIWRKALADGGIEGELADQIVGRIADGYAPWTEASFPGLLGNVVAGRIANRLDLGGTNCVVDAACASSLSAAHLASLELSAGRADMVITGGVDTFNDIFMYMCFSKTPALSPTGDARPFDAQGDGTIIGEGIGMVVLKRLDDAERDGDTIYAVLKGVGSSSDGRGKAIYAPSADGQKEALKTAYGLAGVSPDTIELVEAHGTGTKVGDAVEVSALNEVYRAAKADGQWAALGSVKSQIGHTKAAAGVAGMIKAALALHNKVLPATQKVREPLAVLEGSPFYLNTQARPWLSRAGHPRRAAVSALGFGGANFHALLEEHGADKQAADWDGWVELIALSGETPAALEAALGRFTPTMPWHDLREAAHAARTAFSPAHPHRLALVVEKDTTDLASVLASARTQLQAGKAHVASPDGVYYGSGAGAGALGVLFPGQGAQYVGMGRDLFCQFPEMLQALTAADAAYAKQLNATEQAHGDRLSDRLFPAPTFSPDGLKAQEADLRRTDVAQPAIGAMALGAYRVLEGFGLAPDAVAGHSYGELAALCAAGRLSEADFFALSCMRGRLMAGDGGDRGSMLAVQAPLADIEALITTQQLDVVLANKNTPTQGVLSGATEAIERAEAACKAAGLKAVRLPVGAAFHSALVADAARPFRAAIESVTFAPAAFPVYANTTGAVYPESEADARDLLGYQLAKPVEFVAEIEAMHASGVRTFLEVGPGARMGGLVKATLGDKPFHVVAIDGSAGRRTGTADLARALAQLATLGYALRLDAWEGGDATYAALRVAHKKPAMSFPISGVNHRAKAPATGPLPAAAKRTAAPSNGSHVNGASNGSSNGASGHAPAAALSGPRAIAAPVNGNGNGNGNGYANGNGTHAAPVTPAPVASAPVSRPAPAAPAVSGSLVAEALRATQEGMAALQKMQEQTAQLHRQFLQGQEHTQQAFRSLVDQQQHVIAQAMGMAPAPVAYAPAVASRPVAPVAVVAPAPVAAPRPVPVAVAAAPVKAAAPVAAPRPAAGANVEAALLAVVAEKTGYPVEMLNQDMDMESDLGIDSIKRVEILSALQEKLPEAPVIKPEHLGTLRTLRQISAFLTEGMPAASTPSAAPVVTAAAAPAIAPDRIQSALLTVVAEKTGYPVEMLNLDMDMESDLGIDSIKRVEILSALQESLPEAPVIKPEHLGTLRTLRQIIGFLSEGMPLAATSAAPVAAPAASAPTGVAPGRVQDALLAVVAEKTGYPVEMLNLDMDMESDLGIDSIKRVEILSALQEQLPEAPVIKPEHLGTLRTLRQMIDFLGQGAAAGQGVAVPTASAPAPALAPNRVETVLVAIVAEKTGYPAEMLNLDMDMESDLGIDSIKRVEILSAVQESLPEAPVITPEHLGSLRTLRQMIVHLAGSLGASPAAAAIPDIQGYVELPELSRVPQSPAPTDSLSRQVLSVEDLSSSRPAISLNAGAEVWIADENTELGQALAKRLQDAGYKPQLVSLSASSWPASAGVAGLVVLAADREAQGSLWAEEQTLLLKRAFRLAQHVRQGLVTNGQQGGAFFTTVSRIDGAFGLRGRGLGDATTGGLAGLAKTARHEWPEVACKALDLAAGWTNANAMARAIADELFLVGPAEVGLAQDRRVATVLTETPLNEGGASPFAPGDVVVVSGGARGVTAEAAIALGRRFQPTLVLLGRSPLPEAEPTWLAGLQAEGEIKQALSRQPNGPATPKELQAAYQRTQADREVRRTMARLEATGATVRYVSLDVRDEAAVASALDAVRAEFGPVRGLVHGAGVLADKLIADKTLDQFDSVFDTKVQGLRALLKAIGSDELKAIALFSSVTGRQGRKGQSDYAMANEVLNKLAQAQAAARPGCRVVAVNWGPWDGGMVTPALKRLFAEEGVGVVPLEAGADYLASELCQGPGAPVEVLVMGRVGASPSPTNGTAKQAPAPKAKKPQVAFSREVDVAGYPFLASHVINGKAVLPAAMMVEWMAHGALHANPGLAFAGLEDFRVYKGVILNGGPASIRVTTVAAGRVAGVTRVEVELRGNAPDVLHAQATVLLAAQVPVAGESSVSRPATAPYGLSVAEAYRDVLFHGRDFQGITAVTGVSAEGIVASVEAAPAPRAWIDQPLRDTWLADPLALDAAFQLMILWSVDQEGAPCLPCYAESYHQYRAAFPAEGVTVVARVRDRSGNQLVTDFAFLDAKGALVAELLGAEATVDANLKAAFSNNALAAVHP